MVTTDQLKRIFPSNKNIDAFVDPVNKTLEHFEIAHVAMFLAQVGHESVGLSVLKENLNYSAEGLARTFPRYFRGGTAGYARNPQAIANRVYADRMGNGSESSGDGWRYRGRGAIQLTGKNNYKLFAEAVEMDLDSVIAYLETPEGALMSAGWYWDENDIESIADDVVKTTKRINGGTNGLAERKALYVKAQKVLA